MNSPNLYNLLPRIFFSISLIPQVHYANNLNYGVHYRSTMIFAKRNYIIAVCFFIEKLARNSKETKEQELLAKNEEI